MPSGGARKGAGLPKGTKCKKTVEAELIREFWRKRIAEDKEELYIAMLNKARGCKVQKKNERGEDYYIDLPPDPAAFKALVEHSIGKAKESVDVTSNGETILQPKPEQVERFVKRHK